MNEILSIAEKVNNMSDGMIQLRIKALKNLHDTGYLSFEQTVELNFLCIKVLTIYK